MSGDEQRRGGHTQRPKLLRRNKGVSWGAMKPTGEEEERGKCSNLAKRKPGSERARV